MFVIARKKLFVLLSGLLMVLSLISVIVFGMNLSIEFTGGSIIETEFTGDRPSREVIVDSLNQVGLQNFLLQPVEDNRYVLRSSFLTEGSLDGVIEVFQSNGGEVTRQAAIGPSVGQELRTKSVIAIAVVVTAIISFIAFAFRQVSKPIKSWKYGVTAIVSLIFDVLIPTGFMTLLGYLIGYEIDLLFVMALLVILGYSINDTIIVFDRVRENLLVEQEKASKDPNDSSKVPTFGEVVGRSLTQTYARSLNTSFTTLLVLIALYVFGGESTNHFALVLIVGIIAGSYSSIFLASPLLVYIAGDRSILLGKDEAEKSNSDLKLKGSYDPALEE